MDSIRLRFRLPAVFALSKVQLGTYLFMFQVLQVKLFPIIEIIVLRAYPKSRITMIYGNID